MARRRLSAGVCGSFLPAQCVVVVGVLRLVRLPDSRRGAGVDRRTRPCADGPAIGQIVCSAALALVCLAQPYYAFRYYRTHGPLWTVNDNGLLAMSVQLADVMRGRDGLIAMGAVAGVATYVMERPVLEIEGIVADLRMVRHVKAQDGLGEVLNEYGADYLVVTLAGGVPMDVRNNCYVVTQPHQQWAGKRSAKMHGAICAAPVARFRTVGSARPWSSFPLMETSIWICAARPGCRRRPTRAPPRRRRARLWRARGADARRPATRRRPPGRLPTRRARGASPTARARRGSCAPRRSAAG